MTIKLVVKSEKPDENQSAKTFTFDDLLITLGSNQSSSVPLADANVAAEQAIIINENASPLFINRSKGTILNNVEIEQGVQYNLRTGDRIKIGSYQIYVVLAAQDDLAPTTYLQPQIQSAAAEAFQPEPKLLRDAALEETKLDARSFKDILKGLRKEEDEYYFQIVDADGAKRRIAIESDDLLLGWNEEQNLLTSNKNAEINRTAAVVRKDWSGITIYPNGEDAILINDALLEAGTLLRNGDRIVFSRRVGDVNTQIATLTFCEPAALVELNQILPQELMTNAREIGKSGEIAVEPEPQPDESELLPAPIENKPPREKSFANKKVFGYFNRIEIVSIIAIIVFGSMFFAIFTYLLLEVM